MAKLYFFLASAIKQSLQQHCASVFWTTKTFPGTFCRSGCENVTVASSIYQQPSGSLGSVKGAILHQGWMPTEASICKVFPAKTPGHCALVTLTSRPHVRRAGRHPRYKCAWDKSASTKPLKWVMSHYPKTLWWKMRSWLIVEMSDNINVKYFNAHLLWFTSYTKRTADKLQRKVRLAKCELLAGNEKRLMW